MDVKEIHTSYLLKQGQTELINNIFIIILSGQRKSGNNEPLRKANNDWRTKLAEKRGQEMNAQTGQAHGRKGQTEPVITARKGHTCSL